MLVALSFYWLDGRLLPSANCILGLKFQLHEW